ncbi:hypothetical protein CLCR_06450 [Cladophialophora carrionii]|uniref:Uncharacterized protein n=1 Tax=Cladophialophora carrionii TaxID=86049 RepID=A0A1C1C8G6_9EURO|nr:hypothetical protein CLCR_06450 [Cladophialophora carrionii]
MSGDLCTGCAATSSGLGGRGTHLVIPSLIAPTIAFLLVANRIYWRLRMLVRFGLDDVSAILSMVSRDVIINIWFLTPRQTFLTVQCAYSIAAVDHGYGRPFATLSEQQAAQALKV